MPTKISSRKQNIQSSKAKKRVRIDGISQTLVYDLQTYKETWLQSCISRVKRWENKIGRQIGYLYCLLDFSQYFDSCANIIFIWYQNAVIITLLHIIL